jgi:hypothetical protein
MADEFENPDPQGQDALTQQYMQSALARKQEAEKQMEKLMRALDTRRNMPFDPVMMRVAGALLSPTKTGSFGESLGYAATAGTEEAEKQAARGVDLAKMEFELGQKKLEQQKAMDALKMRMQFFNQPQGALPQAAQPQVAQPLTNVPMASTPEAPAVMPREAAPAAAPTFQRRMPTGMQGLLMAESDPELYKYLSEEDKRTLEELKFGLQQRETESKERVTVESGGVKISMPKSDYDKMTSAIEKGDFATAEKVYTKHGLEFPFAKDKEGTYRRRTAVDIARETELAKGVKPEKFYIRELGGTFEMLPSDYAEYRAAKKAGGKDLQAWLNEFSGKTEPSVKPTARAEPVSQAPKSVTQRETEAKRGEAFAVKGAEKTIEMDEQMANVANTGAETQRSANTILNIINDPKYSGAQGYFSQPGFKNALVTFLKEGVRVGDFNVGMPSFGEALKKIGMSPDEVNAEALLFQKYGNLQLMVSKLQQGQGSVSNYERTVFEKIGGSIDSPLIAMQSAMNALRARSVFDQRNAESYMKWRDRNPDKDGSRYLTSDEYKAEKRAYEQQLEKIEGRFFPKSKPAAPKAESPKAEPKAGGTSKFLQ